ncbi:MAG: tetratricopeptide repeat protein [Elusimicrobiota bacterium]
MIKTKFVAVLVLGILTVSGCNQKMSLEGFKREYNITVEIMETGDYESAQKAFRELLKEEVDTQNPEKLKELQSSIWNNLGAMALEQGDLDEAQRSFEKAIELNPEHTSAYNNIAGLRLRQGRYEEAIKAYDKVLKLNPRYIETINNLANLLIDTRQYSRAGDLLASAIEMKITNERSLQLLARMYAENDVREDAQKVRSEWLRKAGSDPEDRARVGFQYLAFDQPDHARAVLETIREDNPNWKGLDLLEGRILAAEGNWQQATEKLTAALNRDPENLTVRNDLVTVLLRSGKTDDAVEIVEEGTRKASGQAAAWYLKGLVYEEKGDIQTAKSAYERALEITPKHTQALINLAVIVANEDDDPEKAVELLEKALNTDPYNSKIHYNLGRILAVSKIDYKRGIRLLRHAAKGQGEVAKKASDFINRLFEGVTGEK